MSLDSSKPKFSIFTPVHVHNEDRAKWLIRAIDSVRNQTYKNYELIIINDGSTIEVDIPREPWIRLFNQTHQERVIAYNLGFKEATGDWFCCLDSDDEYSPTYLKECVNFIDQFLQYKMFNFGCKYVHKDGTETTREAFAPKELAVGHEVFGGGNIVNGTFIWHRDVYRDLGGFGPKGTDGIIKNVDCSEINYGGVRDLFLGSPYDFSAWAQIEFPELRQFFMVDHEAEPNKVIKELGNPWGNDAYLYFKYTRKYWSKPIMEKFLYLIHPR